MIATRDGDTISMNCILVVGNLNDRRIFYPLGNHAIIIILNYYTALYIHTSLFMILKYTTYILIIIYYNKLFTERKWSFETTKSRRFVNNIIYIKKLQDIILIILCIWLLTAMVNPKK